MIINGKDQDSQHFPAEIGPERPPEPTEIMEASSPLGSLAILPREIRDQIYAYSFFQRNKAYFSSIRLKNRGCRVPCLKWRSYGAGAPGLLKTSTATRSEALQVFLTRTTFHLMAGVHESWSTLATSETDIAEFMMNVELDHLANSDDVLISGLLELFEGAKVLRNSAIIDLETSYWKKSSGSDNSLGCFEPLKSFTGFMSVLVRITAGRYLTLDDEEVIWEARPYEAEKAAEDMVPYLEFSLGPSSVIREWCPPSTPTSNWTGARVVEFCPRDYLDKLAKDRRNSMDMTIP